MDDLLPKLLSFPPHPPPPNPLSVVQYDEGIKAQISAIKGIPEGKLLQQTSSGENALDIINPALNTVPYAIILTAQIAAMQSGAKDMDLDMIWAKITDFLPNFDPRQARYLGSEISRIIEATAAISRTHQQIPLAIPPIRDALLRIDPTGAVFTSKHLLLVKLALESQNYDDVIPVLEKPILYIPGSRNQPKAKHICDPTLPPQAYITPANGFPGKGIRARDVLEYFLYSGMVYIASRNWKRALQCLEDAVTYPAKDNSISKIMVEAYKKWVLVNLLVEGKLMDIPKASSVTKLYHTLAKPYESVARIFQLGTASRLKSEVEAAKHIWQNDCNTGLILNVLAAYQQFQIRNLAGVHNKISILEIHNLTMSAETGAKLPNPQAVETLVQNMIADGSLRGTLSNPSNQTSVLTFSQSSPILSEKQVQAELAASTLRIKSLTQEIRNTDRILTHDKDYVKHLQKQKKTTKIMHDQGIGGDMDWNGADDEDLMDSLY